MHHLIVIWSLGVLAIALTVTWDKWSYQSWRAVGWTGPAKMPRGWCKRRQIYGEAKYVWEIALRIGNRLHAIVVWW